MRGERRGFTQLELIVVITLMSLVAGVTALSLPRSGVGPLTLSQRIQLALDSSARTGRPVRVAGDSSVHAASPIILVLPDGQVLGAGIDPFTRELRNVEE